MGGMRLHRLAWILLDPTPAEGGGANPPVTPLATPPATAAAPPATPPAEPTVTLPQAEYQRLYGATVELGTLKDQMERAQRDAEAQATIAKAKAGEIETAFNEFKETAEGRVNALREKVLAREVRVALNAGLIGVNFASPHAAEQAKILLQTGLKAVEAGDEFKAVHVDTGADGVAWIRQKLSSPEMAHFLAPTTTGGAPPSGGGNPAPPATPPGGDQLSPVEKLLHAMREQNAAQAPQPGFSGFTGGFSRTPNIVELATRGTRAN